MRPPSYYTSLANSNSSSSTRYNSGNISSPSSSYYSSSLPTSHQQLRSSFSSSSSSSYVTRSHLPYVSQSMLVAHCITGGGSTTKPYGYNSSSSTRPTSYLSTQPSGSSNRSYSSSSSYLSSKPISTKKNPYLAASSSNYSSSSRQTSSYLSPSTAHFNSSYRPTTISSSGYNYKPIRLRERPILTQISRQINNTGPNLQSTRVHSYHTTDETTAAKKVEENDQSNKESNAEEEGWSSDVARNISRNKYLIKFREFDKRNSISPVQLLDDEIQKSNELLNVHKQDLVERADKELLKIEPEEKGKREKMKLPLSEIVKSDELTEKQQHQFTVDPKAIETAPNKNICDKQKFEKAKLPEKPKAGPKKNIKLKLKTFNANASNSSSKPNEPDEVTAEQAGISTIAEAPVPEANVLQDKQVAKTSLDKKKVPSSAKTPPGENATSPSGEKTKVKKLVKKSSSKASIGSPKVNDDTLVIQTNEISAKSNPPPSDSVPKKLVKKVSKPRVQVDDTTDTKKVKKSEPKSREVTTTNERKVLSLKQSSGDSKEVIIGHDEINKKKTKQQTKILSSSQKDVVNKSILAGIATSKSANPSGESSPIISSGTTNKRIRFREYKYDDFNFLSVLGHGGWGFVILAELKDHDACFAVKCIKKITIVEDDDFDSIMIERKVLTLGNVHPFICKLFCTFETEGYLFFVMEYCAGGDLMFHVQKEGKFTESRCRFYAAEIICAIRFLHNRHIIYRDLKLDNILLDSKGHVRLVDFGMCQCRTYREEMLPSNFCGTPEYISPEIIKGVPYNHSVDWWSFGVLLYEMAVGKMPFRGNDENELLWNVCYEQIHYPMFLTKELTSLLQLLLEREPTKRMGMSTCKAGDICDQPWFRGVDWPAVEGMRVTPPFVPEVNCKRDVQNFDTDFTQSTPELSPVDASTLERIDQNQFLKFPYTNPNIFIFD